MSVCNVYWIHQPKHTDIFSQGYVGVTNNFTDRMNQHARNVLDYPITRAIKKYGWDNLVKKVIVIADKNYCFDIEAKLRPLGHIGWNIIKGGGIPPDQTGTIPWNKGLETSDEIKEKQRQAKLGTVGNRKGKKNSPEHIAKMKATKALNPRIWTEEERKHKSLKNTGIVYPRASCLNCRFEGGVTGMARWHFDKCRNKGELNWQQ